MNKHNEIRLSIPEPCHESWDAMIPSGQGRHCASCRKTVIDFTKMTDEEIVRYLSHKNCGETCGRFEIAQLNRNLIYSRPSNTPLWRKLLLALTFGFGIANTAFSQNLTVKTGEVRIEEPVKEKRTKWKEIKQPADNKTANNIHGKVRDAKTGEELPFAFIMVEETGKTYQTDLDGNFSIPIPDSMKRSYITLSCRMVGYSPSFTKVKLPPKADFQVEINIAQSTDLLGGLVEVVKVKRSIWHTMIYRIKRIRNYFRHDGKSTADKKWLQK